MSQWIAEPDIDVVIPTGGTGLTGRDGSPEAIIPLLDKTIDGFGELFRVLSFETIGTSSLQSRCLAGVANGTFLFVLPGSVDAVSTAWDRLIAAQLNAETRPYNLVQLKDRLRNPTTNLPTISSEGDRHRDRRRQRRTGLHLLLDHIAHHDHGG